MCQAHPAQLLNFFCEECDVTICIRCKIGFHKSYSILTLADKYKRLEEKLRQCLKKSFSRSVLETMEKFQASFEQSIQCSLENLEKRYFAVKEQLKSIYERYCSELHKKRLQFFEKKERLKNLHRIQEKAKILLTEPFSSILVREAQMLLMELTKVLPENDEFLRKPTFVNPTNGSDVCSKAFQMLCDNSILGYITY